MGAPGFEPGSRRPKRPMIGQATPRARRSTACTCVLQPHRPSTSRHVPPPSCNTTPAEEACSSTSWGLTSSPARLNAFARCSMSRRPSSSATCSKSRNHPLGPRPCRTRGGETASMRSARSFLNSSGVLAMVTNLWSSVALVASSWTGNGGTERCPHNGQRWAGPLLPWCRAHDGHLQTNHRFAMSTLTR